MRLKVFPLRTKEEFQAVNEAAKQDNHNLIQPTHYVTREGQIVGAFCIGNTVWWWLDSSLKVRDSWEMFDALETLQRHVGVTQYVILLPKDSPYNAVVEQVGFEHMEDTQVFRRVL